jgi:hypothetical protein
MEPQQAVKGTLPILELALSYGPDKGYGLPACRQAGIFCLNWIIRG